MTYRSFELRNGQVDVQDMTVSQGGSSCVSVGLPYGLRAHANPKPGPLEVR